MRVTDHSARQLKEVYFNTGKAQHPNATSLYRDGQSLKGDAVVFTNLHQPRDWWLYDQYVKQVPDGKRVFFAIGCHPKQATLLSAANLGKLEKLAQQPGVVAVGECGLDYSAR